VAANIATALARSGRRTVLAETAAFHGSLPTILGIPARRRMDRLSLNSGSQLDQAAVADTLQTHASGLQVMFGPSGNQAPPTADGLIALWDALKAMTDTVVVDLDSAVDAFGQVTLRLADRIWVVTTPEPAGIERAAGLIQLLEQWGVRPQKIDVLVNQTSPAMVVGLADIAQQTERAIAIVVPASPEACFEATRRGVTLAEVDPGQPAAQALTAFSDALVQAAAAARG
jgi:Flp pilus assembly CpaE family ATPase